MQAPPKRDAANAESLRSKRNRIIALCISLKVHVSLCISLNSTMYFSKGLGLRIIHYVSLEQKEPNNSTMYLKGGYVQYRWCRYVCVCVRIYSAPYKRNHIIAINYIVYRQKTHTLSIKAYKET